MLHGKGHAGPTRRSGGRTYTKATCSRRITPRAPRTTSQLARFSTARCSMTEFKRIIGRGTRVQDDHGTGSTSWTTPSVEAWRCRTVRLGNVAGRVLVTGGICP